jgi:hypothetical protein
MKGLSAFGLAALFALGCRQCERGCLSTWLTEHGLGGSVPRSPSRQGPSRGIDLSGSDCSDGLLRCVDGRVEASRAAHLPEPCDPAARPEGDPCACPYDLVLTCALGCAAEGMDVIGAPTDAGAAQLCRPAAPSARGLGPSDVVAPEICAEEGYRCADGIVRMCARRGQPSRPTARCVNGCQTLVALPAELAGGGANIPNGPSAGGNDTDTVHGALTSYHGATVNPDGVASILCRRVDAERR